MEPLTSRMIDSYLLLIDELCHLCTLNAKSDFTVGKKCKKIEVKKVFLNFVSIETLKDV